jgi:peptidoglycan/LPS O-acetylase OafA/YrhL
LNVLPVFAAAWVSWWVIENPFLAWKDQLAAKRAARKPNRIKPRTAGSVEPREAAPELVAR